MPASLHRNFFQRIFGICATKLPADPGCFRFDDGRLLVDLSRATELAVPGGALRVEEKGNAARVLVVRGDEDSFHAFPNRCTHGGRRLDPVPGEEQVQCCSVGKSTFDYEGERLSGSAERGIHAYSVTQRDGFLEVRLDESGA